MTVMPYRQRVAYLYVPYRRPLSRRRYGRGRGSSSNGAAAAAAVAAVLALAGSPAAVHAATTHHHDHHHAAPAIGRAAAKAIAYARHQLGDPYVWGGTGPYGYDCSGLVMMAYRAAGIYIPRTTQTQWPALRHISRAQLRPGDLIYYAGSDGTVQSPGHVVMYIGHGNAIQAYATGYPIEITPLADIDAGGLTGYARP